MEPNAETRASAFFGADLESVEDERPMERLSERQRGSTGISCVGAQGGALRWCSPPILTGLKPKAGHPILHDGDADRGVPVQPTQVRQVV
jgi:hypothetical protein